MSIEHLHAVPNLTTALTGPLLTIEQHLLERQAAIEAWLRSQWLETPAPFYCSVDLRNAGFKLAPVDTNLFPAGFNNLNPAFMPLCIQAVQSAIERVCPAAAKLLLIPENHTRNLFYMESVATLADIIRKAGFEVRIGTLQEEIREPTDIHLPSGRRVRIEPLVREGRRLGVDSYTTSKILLKNKNNTQCMILLNNVLSAGRPAILEDRGRPGGPPRARGGAGRRGAGRGA